MTLIKSFSRFIHLLSASFLSGTTILNYLFSIGEKLSDEPSFPKISAFAGVFLIISGVCNIFLIKAGKKLTKEQKIWVHFFELKFLLALLLTPAIKPLQRFLGFDEQTKITIQFYLVIFMLVYSVGIKAYREDVLNNFNADTVEQKLEAFQKKFQEVSKQGQPIKVQPYEFGNREKEELNEAINQLKKDSKIEKHEKQKDK